MNDPANHEALYCPRCDDWTYRTAGECDGCTSARESAAYDRPIPDFDAGYELRVDGEPRSACTNAAQRRGWDLADADEASDAEREAQP